MSKRRHKHDWTMSTRKAYGGGIDLEDADRDGIDTQKQDSHMSWTNEMGPFPAGEGISDAQDSTTEEFKLGAEIGHDIQELTSDPPPVTRMTEHPEDAYKNDNDLESTDVHLGSSAPAGFPIGSPEDGGRDGWMYEPDQGSALTTRQDELGHIQDEAEKQSPFVKTFSIRRRIR